MARISTYTQDTTITGQDSLIGTDGNNQNSTKIFPVDALGAYLDENFRNDIGNLIPDGGSPIVDADGNVIPGPATVLTLPDLMGEDTNDQLDAQAWNLRINEGNVELEADVALWNTTNRVSSLNEKTFEGSQIPTGRLIATPLLPGTIKTIGRYLGVRRAVVAGVETEFYRWATSLQPAALNYPDGTTSRPIIRIRVEPDTLGQQSLPTTTSDAAIFHGTGSVEIDRIVGGVFEAGVLSLRPKVTKVVYDGNVPVGDSAMVTTAVEDTLYAFYNLSPLTSTIEVMLQLPNDPPDGSIVRISNLWGKEGVVILPGTDADNMGTNLQFIQGVQDELELDDFRASFELIYTGEDAPGWVVVGGRGSN